MCTVAIERPQCNIVHDIFWGIIMVSLSRFMFSFTSSRHAVRAMLFGLLATMLSGCMDFDTHFHFKPDGSVKTAMVIKISKEMYELIALEDGNAFCNGKDEKRSEQSDGVSCTMVQTSTVEELTSGNFNLDLSPSQDGQNIAPITVSEIAEGVLKVNIDFVAMMESEDGQEEMDTPEMRAVVKAAFAGNHMSFGFTGVEIMSSTGEIWDDGKTTSIKVPMANLIDKTAPESFTATIRYKEIGWWGTTMAYVSAAMTFVASLWPF